jgi:hypothetical protein
MARDCKVPEKLKYKPVSTAIIYSHYKVASKDISISAELIGRFRDSRFRLPLSARVGYQRHSNSNDQG